MRATTASVPDVESRGDKVSALSFPGFPALPFVLTTAVRGLIAIAGELASKHIYLDPYDAADNLAARAYCGLCLRYGLNFRAIDHAESCLVGRAIGCVSQVNELLPKSSERISATSSTAPTQQEGAAAEGPSCALEVNDETKERRIEYLADPFGRKANFNPYAHPCTARHDGMSCELELFHSGAHCRNRSVWTDDGRRFA